MWTTVKHADSMEFDGNLMVVLMTECRTVWRDPRSIAVLSRAPPAQKIYSNCQKLPEQGTDHLAVLAVAPSRFW